MDVAARRWFDSHTFDAARFDGADLLTAKRQSGQRVSVVIPARNEAATVAAVVGQIRQALMGAGLVDELVVLDSDSTDDTAAVARAAGAAVFAARDIDTGTPVSPGKGEALWKSLFVTSGDLLVFIDADLTEWGPHFVTGLLGPLLTDPDTLLSKGFYDRLADDLPGEPAVPTPDAAPQGGRVTELVARPLLNLYWPQLAGIVQPLSGEYAGRRALLEQLPFVSGYGVEIGMLVDLLERTGLAGRAGAPDASLALLDPHPLTAPASDELTQFRRVPGGVASTTYTVEVSERPPVASLPQYAALRALAGGVPTA